MINFNALLNVPSMNKLEFLVFLKEGCHLTGSRYMAKKNPTLIAINPATDWDFVISEDSPFLEKIFNTLREVGILFTNTPNFPVPGNFKDMVIKPSTPTYATNASTVGVLKCYDDHINIIVKKKDSYDSYIKMFEIMSPEFYVKHIWKSSPENKKIPKEEMMAIIRDRIELLVDFHKDAG